MMIENMPLVQISQRFFIFALFHCVPSEGPSVHINARYIIILETNLMVMRHIDRACRCILDYILANENNALNHLRQVSMSSMHGSNPCIFLQHSIVLLISCMNEEPSEKCQSNNSLSLQTYNTGQLSSTPRTMQKLGLISFDV